MTLVELSVPAASTPIVDLTSAAVIPLASVGVPELSIIAGESQLEDCKKAMSDLFVDMFEVLVAILVAFVDISVSLLLIFVVLADMLEFKLEIVDVFLVTLPSLSFISTELNEDE